MRKYLVKNRNDFEKVVRAEINLDKTVDKAPLQYPAVVIVAYAGERWDELDFVYLDDFGAQDKPLDCTGVDPTKQSTGKADSLTEGDCFSCRMDDLPKEG